MGLAPSQEDAVRALHTESTAAFHRAVDRYRAAQQTHGRVLANHERTLENHTLLIGHLHRRLLALERHLGLAPPDEIRVP